MSLDMWRGSGLANFCPSIAAGEDGGGPTLAELEAGLDFSGAFNQIQGLEPQRNPINVARLRYRQEAQVEGPEQFQNVVVTLLEDDGSGSDADALERRQAKTTMAKGVSGWLVLFRHTQEPELASECYFIHGTVSSQAPNWTTDAQVKTLGINFVPDSPLYEGEVQGASA